MTRDEILALPAGRKLDEIVAKNVMGWGPPYGYHPRDGAVWYPEHGPKLLGRALPVLAPHYSTDIAAAWEVVESPAWGGHWAILPVPLDGAYAIWRVRSFADEHIARADTAPLAICRAALLAVCD